MFVHSRVHLLLLLVLVLMASLASFIFLFFSMYFFVVMIVSGFCIFIFNTGLTVVCVLIFLFFFQCTFDDDGDDNGGHYCGFYHCSKKGKEEGTGALVFYFNGFLTSPNLCVCVCVFGWRL